ncbi:MAG: CO dehydrogenase/acetyl-CoA synthase complex subunit epsilon [Candidatus Altiarchaeota archaeon]|nr:CO dehydrogenase/acetyl-CoA synthase complex subunit epsilon [Candidatus Altiarchaeota archaeon]
MTEGRVDFQVGRIREGKPRGKTPFPQIPDIRDWDMKLLARYKPIYMPSFDSCDMCGYGKCDLSNNKKGACGINITEQTARRVLLSCCMGVSAHLSHAREFVEEAIRRKGEFADLRVSGTDIPAPLCQIITGTKPTKLIHLKEIIDYCSEQIVDCVAACHVGQENNNLDFESKSFHMGMIDSLSMELADVAQIIGYDFDNKDVLVEFGFGIDLKKPFILFIGHNIKAGAATADYLHHNGIREMQIGGLCCTGHDMARQDHEHGHDHGLKIIGSMADQLQFVKSGAADVIVIDEQCVRVDIVELAKNTGAILVATSKEIMGGLKNISNYSVDEAVGFLKKERATFHNNMATLPEILVRLANDNYKERKDRKFEFASLDLKKASLPCIFCHMCRRSCPFNLEIDEAVHLLKEKGDDSKLREVMIHCISCGKCEAACPMHIPIVSLMMRASYETVFKGEAHKLRAGTGPVRDVEVREVGGPVVMGSIPGIVAIVGCPAHSDGPKIAKIAEEFTNRRYIVMVSGCAAMQIAKYSDLYENTTGRLEAGCLLNTGSCVSNAHILGAAIKIPAIFAREDLDGNYENIADYILNKVGAVGIAYGAMSQKACSIAHSVMRLGIPVILGPAGAKYGKLMLGDPKDEKTWEVYDKATKKKVKIEPAPQHLLHSVQTVEETIVLAAKLCMRPNDTGKGRQIKLSHYIDLHKKYFGREPEDYMDFIRGKADVPMNMSDTIKLKGERGNVDSTLLEDV